MSKATITDVARMANVSRKTVSRVLNAEAGVKVDTQVRVQNAIKQLGYTPDLSARRLRTRQSYLIGLIFADFPGNFYSSMIISGAIEACDEHGYDLLIRPLKAETPSWADTIEHMLERSNPDGVIVVPPLCDDRRILSPIEASGRPLVKVAAMQPGNACNIHCNEESATRRAIEHLLSLGHQRIGMINCLKGHAAGEWRQRGYQQALKDAGIAYDASLVEHHPFHGNIMEQSARRLLSLPQAPTAIFAASDTTAAILYRVASQMGFRIPHDLSIVGFDDEPMSQNLWPPLTTVKQPVPGLGKVAVTALIKQQIQGRQDYTPTPLDCELVIRNSTGPFMLLTR